MMKRKSKERWIYPASMKKKKKNPSYIGMMDMENFYLIEEIIMEILARLPVQSVLRFRLVSKSWRSIIDLPSFAHKHLLCHLGYDHDNQGDVAAICSGKLGFVFMNWTGYRRQIYYGEYGENYNELPSFNTFSMTNFNSPFHRYRPSFQLASCNGLICDFESKYKDDGRVYICNPITRECVCLPTRRAVNNNIDEVTNLLEDFQAAQGFGYHPSTNEYKVVKIYQYAVSKYPFGSCQVVTGEVHVYTLGDGRGWRYKGNVNLKLNSAQGMFINGALHWLDRRNMTIVAFDLADEEFRVLPSPPCFQYGQFFQLKVLGGYLCVLDNEPYGKKYVSELWLFKKNNGYYDTKEKNFKLWSWIRECSIPNTGEPFALGKKGKVLLRSQNKFFGYYPKIDTTKLLDFKSDSSAFSFRDVFVHLNSFVSLKALGEEHVETMESAIDGTTLDPMTYLMM